MIPQPPTQDLKSLFNFKKVLFPTFNGWEYIKIIDIKYFKAECNHTFLFLNNRKDLLLSCSLQKVEELLTDYFFRCHKSYIVNIINVKSVHANCSSYYIIMEGETKIPLAKRRKTEFIHELSQFNL